jgi:hypothetical protein
LCYDKYIHHIGGIPMGKQLLTEADVKKALNIDSFRNVPKAKLIEFVSLIPSIDKDVAVAIINQFPAYSDMVSGMVGQLGEMCDTAMDKASESQKDAISAYKLILIELGELVKKDNISKAERDEITEKMILVADRISAKDSEYKTFLVDIVKAAAPAFFGTLLLGAVILGVNTKGTQIPILKK